MLLAPALDLGPRIQDTFKYNVQENSLGQLLGNLVGLILIFALILFLFFILISGINWISADKPDKVEAARNQLTNAVIGLAITMGAWALWKLMQAFFGVSLTG